MGGSRTELFVSWMLEPAEAGLYYSPETDLSTISETDSGPLSPGKTDWGETKAYHPA